MNKDYFEDIFKDFFEESKIEENAVEQIEENINIDELNIDEESKSFLQKIVNYITNYDDTKRYIPFNFCISFKNEDTIEKICNTLARKNYVSDGIKEVSLYQKETLEDAYNTSGIVIIKDLEALDYLGIGDKRKTVFVIEELIKKENKTITILVGTNEELNSIFSINDTFKDKFLFTINESKPDIQEIYRDILSELKKQSDVKLLDYIGKTYPNNKKDYDEYKRGLIDYILLNNDLPKLESKKTMDEIFKELNELTGLSDIKKTLKDLSDLIDLRNKSKDLKIDNVNMHMVFLGNPGTGKTTVARLVKDILYNLGYIKENKLIEVTSKDLVGEYVGQTAPKTQSVIDKAMGGILFIDEAYTLSTSETNSYNQEAIMTLMEAMENKRNEIVLIFAGYTKEMKEFLNSNSGISSRIGYTLDFKDYTNEELTAIFKNMMEKAGFTVEKEAYNELQKLIDKYRVNKNFGNARFIRNVYEKSVIKHANNTKNSKDIKVLNTITKNDISDDGLIDVERI